MGRKKKENVVENVEIKPEINKNIISSGIFGNYLTEYNGFKVGDTVKRKSFISTKIGEEVLPELIFDKTCTFFKSQELNDFTNNSKIYHTIKPMNIPKIEKKQVVEKGIIKKIYEMNINGTIKYSVELELESQYMNETILIIDCLTNIYK